MNNKKIAVIGIGCRLPGNNNTPDELWDSLLNKVNAISDVPVTRWSKEYWYDPDIDKAGKIKNKKGGFIDGIEKFDAEYFNIFPAEASKMDPQQRLLLEVTHEAFEDAGLQLNKLKGSKTSVFVGSFLYDHLCIQTSHDMVESINGYSTMGTALASLANRLSHVYDLKGPSLTLDTACSSSLVAIHYACNSIINDEADMAIACGVNVILNPQSSILLSKGGFLSSDGYCKSFDENANGYVRSEGVGTVIFKSLDKAIDDGDHIYGVILSSGVNHDGNVADGFTVPSFDAQTELLKKVYTDIDPASISYVEAHGTGTAVGDPIEARSLGEFVGQAENRKGNLIVGSLKSNLGHLEGASGIAGFIKSLLMLSKKQIPANINITKLNPKIDFNGYRLTIPTEMSLISDDTRALRTGVNSFGAGGTNAHVVIEEYQQNKISKDNKSELALARPFLFYGHDRAALVRVACSYIDFIDEIKPSITDLGHSLISRRSRLTSNLTISAENIIELKESLNDFINNEPSTKYSMYEHTSDTNPRIAFMFSGQGGQWAQMGLELLNTNDVFRESMEKMDVIFKKLSGWSIINEIKLESKNSNIDNTNIVQPSVMCIQISLANVLIHNGITPVGIVGHSIGEVAAAHISGAISLEDAIYVIYHRSRIQNKMSGKGRMLAVGITEDEATTLIIGIENKVSIATINGPEMITLSGDEPELTSIAEKLEKEGKFNRFIRVEVAYHSHHMEGIKKELVDTLSKVKGIETKIDLYSTVYGNQQNGEHIDGEYWYKNVRQSVLMTKTLKSMCDNKFDIFIEVGPHPVLVSPANALFSKENISARAIECMRKDEPEHDTFNKCVGYTIANGVTVDSKLMFGTDASYIKLPLYPWNKETYWSETQDAKTHRQGEFINPFTKSIISLSNDNSAHIVNAKISTNNFPYLIDHVVHGEIVFPATGHLELAYASAFELLKNTDFHIEDINFYSALVLNDDVKFELDIRMEITTNELDYVICSGEKSAEKDIHWTNHSSGRICSTGSNAFEYIDNIKDHCDRLKMKDKSNIEEFYKTLTHAGLHYGKKFQCLTDLWHFEDEILARIELPHEMNYELEQYKIHPVMFDACLHASFIHIHKLGFGDKVYLPRTMAKLKIHKKTNNSVLVYTQVTAGSTETLMLNSWVLDENDYSLIATFQGITCKVLSQTKEEKLLEEYNGCYEYEWLVQELESDSSINPGLVKKCIILFDNNKETTDVIVNKLKPFGVETVKIDLSSLGKSNIFVSNLLSKLNENGVDKQSSILFVTNKSPIDNMDEWINDTESMSSNSYNLLYISKTLLKLEQSPTFKLITFGCTSILDYDSQLNINDSMLIGMMRVIKNECQEISSKYIDLSYITSDFEINQLISEIILTQNKVNNLEVALRESNRFIRKLQPVNANSAEISSKQTMHASGGNYQSILSEVGMIENCDFRNNIFNQPKENEVLIDVKSAGLNFKDIVNILGILPDDAVNGGLATKKFGLEISGTVNSCGALVSKFKVGDEIIARVSDGFAGKVIIDESYVVHKPISLSWAEAASIPIIYITAYYGLYSLANLQKNETILIHSAAGGVGLAAINLAKLAGARIIATAGTKEKHDYLHSIGIDHVFSSRSVEFKNEVMKITNNKGVDVVLNSLTGENMSQSIGCLAPFGRFIEIGKLDIYSKKKLNLYMLGENISYFSVDVDRLAKHKPEFHNKIMNNIIELIEKGDLRPIKVTEFPAKDLNIALNELSKGKTIGKIVMNMDRENIDVLPSLVTKIRLNGSYIVTGGASGFGLEISKWLVNRGANTLILVSRSGIKSEYDKICIQEFAEKGVDVHILKIDITNIKEMDRLFAKFGAEYPKLCGVIHGAGVLGDASISNMDENEFRRIYLPKAIGAWNLHKLSIKYNSTLDFFVMLSSISSVLGLYGQVNYAAANYLQDSLASLRKIQNLKGSSINLGVLGEYGGMSKWDEENEHIMKLLESHGMPSISLNDVLIKLENVINQSPSQRMAANFDWKKFINAYPHLKNDIRFKECIEMANSNKGNLHNSGLLANIESLSKNQKHELITQNLLKSLGSIMDMPIDRINADVTLNKCSLDSMALNKFRNWILRNLDINYPIVKLIKGPTINEISIDLCILLESNEMITSDVESSSLYGDETKIDLVANNIKEQINLEKA